MRRIGIVLVVALSVTGLVATPASAIVRHVRTDPNDDPHPSDIRRVETGLSEHKVFIRIRSWDRIDETDAAFWVYLDTTGDDEIDRTVAMTAERHHRHACYVRTVPETVLRIRRSRLPDHRTVTCVMPRSWFHISKTVRFHVSAVWCRPSSCHVADRAPNHGSYLGL